MSSVSTCQSVSVHAFIWYRWCGSLQSRSVLLNLSDSVLLSVGRASCACIRTPCATFLSKQRIHLGLRKLPATLWPARDVVLQLMCLFTSLFVTCEVLCQTVLVRPPCLHFSRSKRIKDNRDRAHRPVGFTYSSLSNYRTGRLLIFLTGCIIYLRSTLRQEFINKTTVKIDFFFQAN